MSQLEDIADYGNQVPFPFLDFGTFFYNPLHIVGTGMHQEAANTCPLWLSARTRRTNNNLDIGECEKTSRMVRAEYGEMPAT